MAGDWMKIELELPDKPEVHAIAGMLNIDPDAVVGKLLRIWQWFDKHTVDGNAYGVTYSLPDRISGVTGFGEAMSFVGWLEQKDKILVMPKFDRHTSKSAKTRALTAKRVGEHKKKGNEDGNARSVKNALPREEKRRVDITTTPIPPNGGEKPSRKKSTVSLQTFLDACKEVNEKPIPESDPIFDYADSVGLTLEFLRIHWAEFKSRYTQPDAKCYKDWRSVYRKSVRGNWFKLWFIGPDGSVALTTVGVQAKRAAA